MSTRQPLFSTDAALPATHHVCHPWHTTRYLIAWKGYADKYNTWEPDASFVSSLPLQPWQNVVPPRRGQSPGSSSSSSSGNGGGQGPARKQQKQQKRRGRPPGRKHAPKAEATAAAGTKGHPEATAATSLPAYPSAAYGSWALALQAAAAGAGSGAGTGMVRAGGALAGSVAAGGALAGSVAAGGKVGVIGGGVGGGGARTGSGVGASGNTYYGPVATQITPAEAAVYAASASENFKGLIVLGHRGVQVRLVGAKAKSARWLGARWGQYFCDGAH